MQCKANSCSCRAEFVTHWNSDHSPKWGVCRYHRFAHPDDWPATTKRIEQYKQWIAFFAMLQHADSDPMFKPQPGESVNEWRNRMEKTLRDLILPTRGDGYENFKETIARLSG